jgi:hypothetical protein
MSQTATCEKRTLPAGDADMLGRHLADEASAQREVIRHLADQERLLVRNDVAGLRARLADGDPMLARLQALTVSRMAILVVLARRLGVPADDVTMDLVLDAVDAADRDHLAARTFELKKLLAEVGHRTRRVNALLRSASDTNEALLHGVLGGQAPIRTYRPDGRRGPHSGLSHFTREI